jgi:ABC-type Fe3+/spermidine/putrescine transport system ATPase subunit
MNNMKPMVEIKGVSKTFGKTTALSEINLSINEGQFFALVGPSGSGKTTLLHILGGFVEPSAGEVHIAGQNVSYLPCFRTMPCFLICRWDPMWVSAS